MPYVRQKTWLPLAPKIAGLSLKESPWGFGRNRGMGQSDTTPGLPQLPIDYSSSNLTTIPGTSIPWFQPITQSQYNALPNMDIGTWLQQNQGTVLLVGGGLFALALLKGMMGGHR